jgi:hypothetical protein
MNLFSLLLYLFADGWQSGASDSLAVLKAARRARDAFETTRRASAPERASGSGGARYQIIGRVRYWYEGGDESDSAPPEPRRIREARARLLERLADASAALPGDEWIAGQRARYLLEDSQPSAAARVAEQCRAVQWWCEALGGLVRHVEQDYAGADSLFSAALADMPDDERCRWNDISSLLEGNLAKRYRELDCAGRAAFEAHWWWLAQPMYSLPANDRRTEHLARETMVRIEQGRRTTLGLYWEDDLRDVLLRYGWPTWWTREPTASPMVESEPRITGHDPSPAFGFTPSVLAFDEPANTRPEDWSLDPPQARERYAPAYAKAFGYLDHQAAAFRRGDSCVMVAAFDLSDDTLFANRPARAALALAPDERTLIVARDSGPATGTRALRATAPCAPLLVSLEAVAPGERHAARARYGVQFAPRVEWRPAISDLLLFAAGDSLPADLDAVLPHALGSTRVPATRKLGVFWELYGVDPADGAVDVSLTMTRRGEGWLRRAAESLGLAASPQDVRLEWREVPGAPRLAPRALAVDVSGLAPGRYVIEVSVTATGGQTVTARRDLSIERG